MIRVRGMGLELGFGLVPKLGCSFEVSHLGGAKRLSLYKLLDDLPL